MTETSCVTAAMTLLSQNMPVLKTIQDFDGLIPSIPPDMCPAAVVNSVNYKEKRLSGGLGGSKECHFDLEIYLWAYYDPNTIIASATDFRGIVDTTKAVFRNSHFLNQLGDTPSTTVLIAGEQIDSIIEPWSEDGGMVLREARLKVHIFEYAVDSVYP